MWSPLVWLWLAANQPALPPDSLLAVHEVSDSVCTIIVNGHEIEGDCRFEVREHSLTVNGFVLREMERQQKPDAAVASTSFYALVPAAEADGCARQLPFEERLRLVRDAFLADTEHVASAEVVPGAVRVQPWGKPNPFDHEISPCPEGMGSLEAELQNILDVLQHGGLVLMSEGIVPWYPSWKHAAEVCCYIDDIRHGRPVDPVALRRARLKRLLDFVPDLRSPRPLKRLEVE